MTTLVETLTPLADTKLEVDGEHTLRVCIWPDIDALQAATGKPDAEAYWEAPAMRLWVGADGETTVLTEAVGTLHFYNNGFGAGVFAHELQHFIQDWISIGGIDTNDPEAAPTLTGDLTNKFWAWFYDQFEEVQL